MSWSSPLVHLQSFYQELQSTNLISCRKDIVLQCNSPMDAHTNSGYMEKFECSCIILCLPFCSPPHCVDPHWDFVLLQVLLSDAILCLESCYQNNLFTRQTYTQSWQDRSSCTHRCSSVSCTACCIQSWTGGEKGGNNWKPHCLHWATCIPPQVGYAQFVYCNSDPVVSAHSSVFLWQRMWLCVMSMWLGKWIGR